MSEECSTSDKPVFNGLLITGLVVNALVMLSLFLAATGESGGLRVFLYLLIGISALAYVGALVVHLGNVKVGAVLIMIGSGVLIPVGGIALIGALQLMQSLKQQLTPAGIQADPHDKPDEAYYQPLGAVIATLIVMLVMALFALFSGFAIGGVMLGGAILLTAAVIHASKNPLVATYGDHIRVRAGVSTWDYVPYASILGVDMNGRKSVVIRYRRGEEETQALIGALGAEQLKDLHDALLARPEVAAALQAATAQS